ncbi:MAG: HNH endonuclease [Gallionella sp.]
MNTASFQLDMAGDWLKIEACTPDKPEVFGIATALGVTQQHAFGCVFLVWRWFDQHTTDGNAKSVTKNIIDALAVQPGMADAMVKVGWLDVLDDGSVCLPHFDRHTGQTAKSRSETNLRVSKHRKEKASQEIIRGIIPRPIRALIYKRDNHTCVYCGRKEAEFYPPETKDAGILHIDHVIPLSQGGSDDHKNLATSCSICNMFKSNRTPEECGLPWPEINGKRLGNDKNVTQTLPREEKRREDIKPKSKDLSAHAAQTKGTRLPEDWVLPKPWGEWALNERPELTADEVRKMADTFKDHWIANANRATGKKADWFATWRNWVRNQKTNPAQSKSVQEARLSVAEQIMGGKNGTHRPTRDITPGRTIEGSGKSIPETPLRLREPDAS